MNLGKTNYRNGGTRGGADQFKWDDVKNDKYRENYLGHSLHAPIGRWQKGKDLTWYAKASKVDRSALLQEEIALAKQRDEDLMNEALGIAPKRRHDPSGQLDAAEMKELLKRGASDREGLMAERVEGVGAAPVAAEYGSRPKKTLAEKYQERIANGEPEEDIYALAGSDARGTNDAASADDERARKKAAKKLKKLEKKERHERKKEKRRRHHEERERYARERSRSPSEGRDERLRGRSRSPSRSTGRPPRRSRSASRDRHARARHRASSPIRRHRSRSASRSRSRSPYSHRRSHRRSRSRER